MLALRCDCELQMPVALYFYKHTRFNMLRILLVCVEVYQTRPLWRVLVPLQCAKTAWCILFKLPIQDKQPNTDTAPLRNKHHGHSSSIFDNEDRNLACGKATSACPSLAPYIDYSGCCSTGFCANAHDVRSLPLIQSWKSSWLEVHHERHTSESPTSDDATSEFKACTSLGFPVLLLLTS